VLDEDFLIPVLDLYNQPEIIAGDVENGINRGSHRDAIGGRKCLPDFL
jgi:hypothetical protein